LTGRVGNCRGGRFGRRDRGDAVGLSGSGCGLLHLQLVSGLSLPFGGLFPDFFGFFFPYSVRVSGVFRLIIGWGLLRGLLWGW